LQLVLRTSQSLLMNKPASEATSNANGQGRTRTVAYWLTISLIVAIPAAFSTAVYRMYSLPKFALLVTGAAALLPLLLWNASVSRQRCESRSLLASRQVLLVSLYSIVIAVSTFLGASPIAELVGSAYNQMGLITHLCFFVVFTSLILVIGNSEKRFRWTLWAMSLTGLAIATYGYVQFFGRDPFVPSSFYTFESSDGPVLRIVGSLGHSNYLANFLLYVAPLAAGLALASRGRARRIGLATAILSAAAIVFSGTRGAWLGLVTGVLTFIWLTRSRAKSSVLVQSHLRLAVLTSIVILFFSALIAINPASQNIAQRARLLVTEKTGSGRTLLWRDSLKMLAQHPLAGCGPEGFREAFLPYRSMELARLAPRTNNESSHNSYIDAAISYGLIGAILYVAIIASSLKLLIRARRQSKDAGFRAIVVSMIASMAAVVVHNLFIFDQISTGLYFFVFAALAQSAVHVGTNGTASETEQAHSPMSPEGELDARRHRAVVVLRPAALLAGTACALFVAAVWYSISIARADVEIKKAIAAATTGDLSEVLSHGNRAISYPDPSGDYRFLFARALALCGDNLGTMDAVAGEEAGQQYGPASGERKVAFTLALSHAEASLTHTLTPDANYVLLAYLAWRLGDQEKLFDFASKAVEADPNFSNSHWLLAEAYLTREERDSAALEAELALRLDPKSDAARSALKRAKEIPAGGTADELIRYARRLANQGKNNYAIRIVERAIQRSAGPCLDCHSMLAKLYETAEQYPEAISEWEAYKRLAPERARAEETDGHIAELKKKAVSRSQ
jgi:O-antigen ligase/tetratricopeptide (TPR) repeat protein